MKKILIVILVFYSLGLISLYLAQRKLMYFPTEAPPVSYLSAVNLDLDGVQIKVIVSKPQEQASADKAILYFPGNAENVWWVTKYMRQFFADHSVYYLNYPGYGGSDGTPTEQSILNAANSLYEYSAKQHKEIVVVGRSLGTGVAVDVASKHKVDAMILLSPYDSIANVAAGHYPIFPVKWLLKDQYDSASKVASVKRINPNVEVFAFKGSADRVVPAKHSDALVAAMKAADLSVTVTEFEGYGHNDITEHPDFLTVMQAFFATSR